MGQRTNKMTEFEAEIRRWHASEWTRREVGATHYWGLRDPEGERHRWQDEALLALRTASQRGDQESVDALRAMDTIGPRIPEYAANAIDRLPGGPAAWRQRDFAEPAQEACRHRLLVLAAGKEIDKSLAESLSAGLEAADHVLSFTYTITATDTASYEACVALEALVRSRYQASTWFDPEDRLPAARFRTSGSAWVYGDEGAGTAQLSHELEGLAQTADPHLGQSWPPADLDIRRPFWANPHNY